MLQLAVESDLAYLSAQESESSNYPWSKSNLIQSVQSGHCCYKFIKSHQSIGYALCMPVLDQVELLNFVVFKQWQGKGLGRVFLQSILRFYFDSGYSSMSLEVRSKNVMALQLYLALGFTEVGQRKNYYPTTDGYDDAFVMRLVFDRIHVS